MDRAVCGSGSRGALRGLVCVRWVLEVKKNAGNGSKETAWKTQLLDLTERESSAGSQVVAFGCGIQKDGRRGLRSV